MKFRKIAFALIGVITLNLTLMGYTMAQSSITDVGTTDYAYTSIVNIITQGIMSVDSKGNFYPDQTVNKFDTAKVLAKIFGYNSGAVSGLQKATVLTGKYNSVINIYQKKFSTKWDSTANMQVEFLLEKGILQELDLAQFVIEYKTGEQVIKNLTKQEMAVYIVRILGKEKEASTYINKTKFLDDTQMDEKKKPYVYYLQSIGIFKGDAKNNFNPKETVNKRTFAILLERTLNYKNNVVPTTTTTTTTQPQTTTPTNTNTTTAPTTTTKPTTSYESTTSGGVFKEGSEVKIYNGTVESLFDNNNAIKIRDAEGTSRIANLGKNLEVRKQGIVINKADIAIGNLVLCIEEDSSVVEIYVVTNDTIDSMYTTVKMALTSKKVKFVEDNVDLGESTNSIVPKASGSLQQILITQEESEITILLDTGKKANYKVSISCVITEEGSRGTIYSLRLGQKLKVTYDGDDATRINIES